MMMMMMTTQRCGKHSKGKGAMHSGAPSNAKRVSCTLECRLIGEGVGINRGLTILERLVNGELE